MVKYIPRSAFGSALRHTLVRAAIVSGSLSGALALIPGRIALADEGGAHGDATTTAQHGHPHRPELLGEALKLDDLSQDQRAAIEGLLRQAHDARGPVRLADAKVLTVLAEQVERSSFDEGALAPALQVERAAGVAEGSVERDVLARLHALLTPTQRNRLVDLLETRGANRPDGGHEGRGQRHAGWLGGEAMKGLSLTPQQKSEIVAKLRADHPGAQADPGRDEGPRGDGWRSEHRQALDTFRGDAFDAAALVRIEPRGERAEHLARAMIPVLTPSQRAALADQLRARAARESRG